MGTHHSCITIVTSILGLALEPLGTGQGMTVPRETPGEDLLVFHISSQGCVGRNGTLGTRRLVRGHLAGWGVGEGPVQAREDSHALGDPGCSGGSRSGALSLQVSERRRGNSHPWQGPGPLPAASLNSREIFSRRWPGQAASGATIPAGSQFCRGSPISPPDTFSCRFFPQ